MFRAPRTALLALACVAVFGLGPPAFAQDATAKAVVSIYRVAPGKQLEFLKWMAARERTIWLLISASCVAKKSSTYAILESEPSPPVMPGCCTGSIRRF